MKVNSKAYSFYGLWRGRSHESVPHVPKGYPGEIQSREHGVTPPPRLHLDLKIPNKGKWRTWIMHPRNNIEDPKGPPSTFQMGTLTQLIRITKRTKQLFPDAWLPFLQIKKNMYWNSFPWIGRLGKWEFGWVPDSSPFIHPLTPVPSRF